MSVPTHWTAQPLADRRWLGFASSIAALVGQKGVLAMGADVAVIA